MKKLLMFLTILFSSLFIFTNVKAETVSTNFGNIDFDFDTFKTQNNLTDYNYYVISLRANESSPMLTFFKNKPTMSALGYNITFNSTATDVVIYMYSNNSWSLFGTYNYCNSKNIIYSTNINNINYSGSSISLVKNDLYYSYIKSYDNELNLDFSYISNTLNLTYDHENNAFVFDNSNNAYDKTLNITKNYWYFKYDGYGSLNFVQSDTPLHLVDFSSSAQQLCSGTTSTNCHDGVDAFLYQIGSGAITNSWSNSYYLDFTKFTNSFSATFMWVNANQRFYHNGNVLNSSEEVISPSNVIFSPAFNTNFIVQDLGDNDYGFITNHITLISQNSEDVDCPLNTDFNDNYCTSGWYNYSTDNDLLTDQIGVRLYFNDNVSFVANKYSLVLFRIIIPFKIQPTKVNVVSGNTIRSTLLNTYNIYDGGSYMDYQIVFEPLDADNNNNINVPVNYIDIYFENLSNYNIDVNSFVYSIYNSYKYTLLDNDPTESDLSNLYNNNSIDNISSGQSSFYFGNFKFNNHGFSDIITSPIRLLNAIISTNSCSPLSFTFPHSNNNITLPCLQSYLSSNLGNLWTLLQFILSGLVCYRVSLGFISSIKELGSPDKDNIEVVDL